MISIIIPTYNEAGCIGELLAYLKKHSSDFEIEIIVADAQSTDETQQEVLIKEGKLVQHPVRCRAAQMNAGAAAASGDILYFVHADTFPPPNFAHAIHNIIKKGFSLGRCRTKFASKLWLLRMNAFFTRFDIKACYGGDQTLFIKKTLFDDIGGYNADMPLMEDYDIVSRAREKGRFAILPYKTLVSARKYNNNSWLEVQRANIKAMKGYNRGENLQDLAQAYKKALRP